MTDHADAIAILLAERDQLLALADRNLRGGHPKQAKTCERHASGCGYAVGVLSTANDAPLERGGGSSSTGQAPDRLATSDSGPTVSP